MLNTTKSKIREVKQAITNFVEHSLSAPKLITQRIVQEGSTTRSNYSETNSIRGNSQTRFPQQNQQANMNRQHFRTLPAQSMN